MFKHNTHKYKIICWFTISGLYFNVFILSKNRTLKVHSKAFDIAHDIHIIGTVYII